MARKFISPEAPKRLVLIAIVLAGVVVLSLSSLRALGNQLQLRSLTIGDNTAGATSMYDFSFTTTSSGTLGSILFEFCANDALVGMPCTPPNGFDASGASLTSQSGNSGFIVSPTSTANRLILTRAPVAETATASAYTFSNVVNPSATGSYYVRLQTFASVDATGPDNDYGGLAFAITDAVSVSAQVPPFLLFCVGNTIPNYSCDQATGNFVDFGNLAPSTTAADQTQLFGATNAPFGYGITVKGPTMTSGNNVVPAVTSDDVTRPGTSQFGINLRANSAPAVGQDVSGPGSGTVAAAYNQPNFFQYVSGDTLASTAMVDAGTRYTVSYMVNVAANQPPGVYVSTLTYVCLANF